MIDNSYVDGLFRLIFQKKRSNNLESRIACRKATSVPGLYKVLNRDRFFGRHYNGLKTPMEMIDISTTGCAFRTDFYVAKGSYFEVEIKGLSEEHTFDEPMIASCEVVYCMPDKSRNNRIGAKFLSIDPKCVEKIREFTERV